MTGAWDAIVVGAGFAGVAAATALADRGARVLVLETRQRPGGRASSWTDPASGEVRDNGQHLLGAFYDETLALLARLGTTGALDVDPSLRLRFWERGRGSFELSCPRLPAPLHWIAAVGRCTRLSAAARAAALALPARARALAAGARDADGGADRRRAAGVASGGHFGGTVEAWLASFPGHEDLAALLRPIALAALNEEPREGSAVLFARVLERLLAAPASRSGLALPRRSLGDLLAGFEARVEARGGAVRYRATALGVRVHAGAATGVSILGAEPERAPCIILAVPHERVTWLLRPELAEPLRAVATVPWSPIVSTIHVYDRPVLPSRFVGLLGTPTQWAFDRGVSSAPPGGPRDGAATQGPGHLVGTLRSAAFADAGRPPHDIAAETERDLAEAFPEARGALVLHRRVFKERRATMRSTPDVQALRPAPETHVRGLLLAGDWTATGLPPTIEGAVASGHRAAALVR